MFLIVQLGCRFRLSDRQLHQFLCESPVARRFVEFSDIRSIPSPKTIWWYREAWAQHDSLRQVFDESLQFSLDLIPDAAQHTGKALILDGTFVDARKRHVSSTVHQQIVDGVDPVEIFENPSERRQRDVDARHTTKNNQKYFGYKTHAKVCAVTKLIVGAPFTAANRHDSQLVSALITANDKGAMVFGDSAYNGQNQRRIVEQVGPTPLFMLKPTKIAQLCASSNPHVKAKGELLKEYNSTISSTRVRIEHVFGHFETVFGGSFVRCVGYARAQAHHWLTAIIYNAQRTVYLLKTADGKT